MQARDIFEAAAVLATAAALLTGAGCSDGEDPVDPSRETRNGVPFEETVTIDGAGYHPKDAEVLVGGTVTWINMDPRENHTAETRKDDYLETPNGEKITFDTHTLTWEEPYTVTFHQPGALTYVSSFDHDMKGSIEVVARKPGD